MSPGGWELDRSEQFSAQRIVRGEARPLCLEVLNLASHDTHMLET